MTSGRSRLALFGQRLPPRFTRRVVVLMPGRPRAYAAAEWRGAIVVVECGRLELEALDGSRHSFGPGAILWLDQLPLRTLHSCGPAPAVLVALARR